MLESSDRYHMKISCQRNFTHLVTFAVNFYSVSVWMMSLRLVSCPTSVRNMQQPHAQEVKHIKALFCQQVKLTMLPRLGWLCFAGSRHQFVNRRRQTQKEVPIWHDKANVFQAPGFLQVSDGLNHMLRQVLRPIGVGCTCATTTVCSDRSGVVRSFCCVYSSVCITTGATRPMKSNCTQTCPPPPPHTLKCSSSYLTNHVLSLKVMYKSNIL